MPLLVRTITRLLARTADVVVGNVWAVFCDNHVLRRAATLSRLNEMSLEAGARDNKALEQSLSEAGFI